MTTVGYDLSMPEAGWKRIEENDPAISWSSGWVNNALWIYSGSKCRATAMKNAYAQFNFSGTKLRIIGGENNTQYAPECEIIIDGIPYIFSNYSSFATYSFLCFEILGLEDKEHSVKIVHSLSPDYYILLDAIDIDSTGQILPYHSASDNKNTCQLSYSGL